MTRPSRPMLVVAALAVQIGCIGVAVAPRLRALVFGREYRLRVAPVDPIDPFRGAYVRLHYPDLPSEFAGDERRVFVRLQRHGDVWRGGPARSRPPESGPYVACRAQDGGLRCGIESYFLPQDAARRMEQSLSAGGIATVRIDGRGNAVLVSVRAG